MDQSTICAISTAAGIGGIAVIRISGENAIKNASKIFFVSNKNKNLFEVKSNTIIFGKIKNNKNEIIDEALVSIFRAPHSYTGEDTVEISCHGSAYIQQQILKLLIENGCVLARAGEFTQRAFLNGKMDLSRAEAVADLINSESQAAHRLAMNQMRGKFSNELQNIRQKLVEFASLIELELDFNEEDVEFADRKELGKIAANIEEYISKLCKSFDVGNAIKNGISVAIVGETNVGKSTLLNILLNEERAIVSEIHGTTRDAIEDTTNIGGIMFRFIDTAGIRTTKDKIENMGIERTYNKIEQASIVLWVIDASQPLENAENMLPKMIERCKNKKMIIVYNKIDINKSVENINITSNYEIKQVSISAKENLNIELLQNILLETAQIPEIGTNDVIVTNVRHFEALQNAHLAIIRIQNGLKQNIPHDLLAQDIRDCIFHISTITGSITTDEILGNIFSKFCIGK
ncbi:MAG: tRNA uridine-5-carboxymethylaminomethyl(34) synthesis GTPase MnmE [Prevotellaceae bacterium]|jgi:tRNA modification GTPase|nr:tRNA uridine-5-carboxymethylaminomethyl(34) synthesis GTPase MnmE [Prevotellaceae bacterium]